MQTETLLQTNAKPIWQSHQTSYELTEALLRTNAKSIGSEQKNCMIKTGPQDDVNKGSAPLEQNYRSFEPQQANVQRRIYSYPKRQYKHFRCSQ
ncbi:hypothetical protein GGR07_000404 [Bacteroides pyogenes]|nr:hypothetical protein [Bacteroides pyogenes]SUV31857.1 Uncharacterised protein [Bacteroides pyogenes]